VQYNVIDSPTGAVPITRVDPAQDSLPPDYLADSKGSAVLEHLVYGGKAPVYDPIKMEGVPVGIQVVGRRWEDEKVVAMMRIVDGVLGNRDFGPGGWDLWARKAPF
jgi:Asp-tRNA(Asn)/Glu-tRNA(Gln) amidotransferase A subunit family amidase